MRLESCSIVTTQDEWSREDAARWASNWEKVALGANACSEGEADGVRFAAVDVAWSIGFGGTDVAVYAVIKKVVVVIAASHAAVALRSGTRSRHQHQGRSYVRGWYLPP